MVACGETFANAPGAITFCHHSGWHILRLRRAMPGSARIADARDSGPESIGQAGWRPPGRLARPIFSGACQAIPQDARVRAVVERVEGRGIGAVTYGVLKRLVGASNKRGRVTLGSITVDVPGGGTAAVHARLLRMETVRQLAASDRRLPAERSRLLLLEVMEPLEVPHITDAVAPVSNGSIPAGTSVRVDLITSLHTGKNRIGDVFQARVVEPVLVGNHLAIPEGAVFEGIVSQAKRAGRPYRSGRMRLSFQTFRLPGGQPIEIAVSATGGALAHSITMDAEGGLHGGPLDRKQALINIGVAYATGKFLDDMIEESAKAALGAAVAGSAATVARYVGLSAGTVMFLMHRGRDVSLDRTDRTAIDVPA